MSWVIGKLFKERWTHVGVYAGDSNIIESVDEGVVMHSIYTEPYPSEYEIIVVRLHDDDLRKRFLEQVTKKIGKKYDFVQLFTSGFIYWLYKKTKLKIFKMAKNPLDSNEKYICSEVIAKSLIECGIDVVKEIGVDLSQIKPADILLLKNILSKIKLCDAASEGQGDHHG